MRFHKGHDGWGRDSYAIPQFGVVGSSDTGMYSDSPAPSNLVKDELDEFRKILRANKIRSRITYTRSGNVFMVKRWVVVHSRDYLKALPLAQAYLAEHKHDTRFIHDAA
jgi:hypothetical protein